MPDWLTISKLLNLVLALDWTKILSGLVPIAIGVALAWWKGGFRALFRKIQVFRAVRKYRSDLKRDASSLAVIGRREGFDLAKVYVEIDVAKSDLMNKAVDGSPGRPNQCVLVGGPGAGKSTYVKKLLLDRLTNSKDLPFLLRLREYGGEKIEDLLAAKLNALGILQPLEFLRLHLHAPHCLCVLDGLDEVRPAFQQSAYEAINSFYKSYFLRHGTGSLIVTCRKEAYRSIPLELPEVWEVIPLKDIQIQKFAASWPLGFPSGKSSDGFWSDLSASPRILEVSRSPLLLVGSLLLYTESNLGIPGERTKYLQKIKNTLVEDWGTAQGHAPDPWRIVYTPLLSNIALQMHLEETAEFQKSKCTDLIARLLPEYGYEKSQAEAFLENLFTKTGILVRDVPGSVVFVQFTLQEFFTSLILSTKCSEAEIAKFAREAWWREAILFSTAQLANPTSQIKALFDAVPMIGAVAVAEAPTPSLELQESAVELTLKQIDVADGTAELPTVSLLRKMSGKIERDFCVALGERLENKNERIAAIAGRSLATAGTAMATEVLSKYPEAWKHCFDTSSYLSSTFEKMVFTWVGTPAHSNWQNAVDLLIKRDERLDLLKLIDLLSALPSEKADYLSCAILKKMHRFSDRYPEAVLGEVYDPICRCIPFVQNKERLQGELGQVAGVHRYMMPGAIPSALQLAKTRSEASETVTSEKLRSVFDRSLQFCFLTSSYLILMASGICSFSLLAIGQRSLSYGVLLITVGLALIAICLKNASFPWMDRELYFYPGRPFMPLILGAFFAGMTLALAVTLPNSIIPDFLTPQQFYVLGLMGVMSAVGISRHPRFYHRRGFGGDIRSRLPLIRDPYFHFLIISALWLAIVATNLIFMLFQERPSVLLAEVLAAFGLIISTWCAVQLALSKRNWNSMSQAGEASMRYLAVK
jgi:hypothetical protein